MRRPVTVELDYIEPGDAGFEYEGKKWTWKKTSTGLEHVGTDRRGLWGVFTNGVDIVRIYKGDLIDVWGEDVANRVFNRQPYPVKCFAYVQSTDQIAVITRGERGYRPAGIKFDGPNNPAAKQEAVELLNDAMGVTKAHAAAMMAGSLFGWDCPAAHPRSYDANGNPIKPKRDSRDAR